VPGPELADAVAGMRPRRGVLAELGVGTLSLAGLADRLCRVAPPAVPGGGSCYAALAPAVDGLQTARDELAALPVPAGGWAHCDRAAHRARAGRHRLGARFRVRLDTRLDERRGWPTRWPRLQAAGAAHRGTRTRCTHCCTWLGTAEPDPAELLEPLQRRRGGGTGRWPTPRTGWTPAR